MGTAEYGATGFYVLPRAPFRSKRDKLLFADLVEQANYRDNGECKRGQLITSTLKLAEETGWSRDMIRYSLDALAKDDFIRVEAAGKNRKQGLKITIVDYDKMQDLSSYKRSEGLIFPQEIPQDNPQEGRKNEGGENAVVPTVSDDFAKGVSTTIPHENPQCIPHSLTSFKQQDKHIKDSCPKRKRVYDESTDAYKLAKYLRDRILRWKPNAKVPNETPAALASWADEMRKMLELDKRDRRDIALVIQWATNDSFWQPNILSAATLRRQFDKLEGQMRRKVVPMPPPRSEPSSPPVSPRTDQNYAGFERRAANDMAFQEMLFGKGDLT
jgi:hypothetical protein